MNVIPFLCGLLLGSSPVALAQAQRHQESPGLKHAVILVIRHAEKPDSGNGLSPAGKQRAQAYVRYFKHFTVDSKPLKLDRLLATADTKESHRPRLTLAPLGKALGLRIDSQFKDKQTQQLANAVQSGASGQHVLICWHHGEIPQLVRALGADPGKLLPEAKWPADVYGWVLQLRYDENGRLISDKTKRINENLMPGDSDPQAPAAPWSDTLPAPVIQDRDTPPDRAAWFSWKMLRSSRSPAITSSCKPLRARGCMKSKRPAGQADRIL